MSRESNKKNETTPYTEEIYEKVSVIMAVFNSETTLKEAIDSIITQDYPNWEFIICNDASTDRTQQILDSYKASHPDRFILLKNAENKRLAFSLNRCLEYATGEYIARMDGDDISTPDRFSKEVRFLEKHSEYDLVGCAMRRFNAEGSISGVDRKKELANQYDLRKGVPFNHATIMAHRYVYTELRGYTVETYTARCEDYDLWFRFFHKGFRGFNLQEPLYLVREDMNAITRRTFKSRWDRFQVSRLGYRLLGFPKTWLIVEFFKTLIKSIVPFRVIYAFRRFQSEK